MYGRIEDGTVPGPFKRLVAGLLRGLTSKADSALVDCLSGDGRRDVDRCAGAEAETARRHLAARQQAGPVAAPATFAQPMPLPTGRKDMRDRRTSWLLAGALVTALAGCTPERAAPVAEPPVTADADMPTPASRRVGEEGVR